MIEIVLAIWVLGYAASVMSVVHRFVNSESPIWLLILAMFILTLWPIILLSLPFAILLGKNLKWKSQQDAL